MSSSSHGRRALSMLLAHALVFTSAGALAEDSEATPHASPSVETSEPMHSSPGGETQLQRSGVATSSINEPTFRAETERMRWPNVPLLATGSVVLAASYLPAMIVAVARDTKDDNDLYIPVAGPWMMLANGKEESGGDKALLAIDGVAQGVGALMLLTSFMIPERVTSSWYLIGSNDLRLTPSRVGMGYGVGAVGRF